MAGLMILASGIFALLSPGSASAQSQISGQALVQLNAIRQEKASWNRFQQKIDSKILVEAKRRSNRPLAVGYPELRRTVTPDSNGRVEVDITARVTTTLTQIGLVQ